MQDPYNRKDSATMLDRQVSGVNPLRTWAAVVAWTVIYSQFSNRIYV
jgi:hypothetical protein